jgi:squalene-hopene/tetraprenyl-beta-curcumene cyclase
MIAALLGRQRANGSWVNEDRRWMEGDPNLSTAFALLALAHCRE